MLCSALAAERGLDVILLEPNAALGKKLRITGKGRCNVTNDCPAAEFIQSLPGDGRFMQSAIHRFGTGDTMALFERLGVPLKVERGRRVFPQSDRAEDIVRALERYMRAGGVDVLHERAEAILTGGDGVKDVDDLKPPARAAPCARRRGTSSAARPLSAREGCHIRGRAPRGTATAWRRRWGTR